MQSLDAVTRADFEPHLNETFQLVLKDGSLPMQLAAIRQVGEAAPGAKREPFSLDFRSPNPIRLPQGIYRLEHERFGAMEIFLVQYSPTEVGAVFS